ncbi:24077_t:CDS:1, partial [Gigaspora rosea]
MNDFDDPIVFNFPINSSSSNLTVSRNEPKILQTVHLSPEYI